MSRDLEAALLLDHEGHCQLPSHIAVLVAHEWAVSPCLVKVGRDAPILLEGRYGRVVEVLATSQVELAMQQGEVEHVAIAGHLCRGSAEHLQPLVHALNAGDVPSLLHLLDDDVVALHLLLAAPQKFAAQISADQLHLEIVEARTAQ